MKTPREVLLKRHQSAEPKLDRMWLLHIAVRPAVVPYQLLATLWRELIWPCRRIWEGLACAWVLIIALHIASSEPATQVAGKAEPPSPEQMQALIQQRRLLAQLIEPTPEPKSKPQSVSPGPRSDLVTKTFAS